MYIKVNARSTMLLQLRLQFMSALVFYVIIIMQTTDIAECFTTTNISSRNHTIRNELSQTLNQSTAAKSSQINFAQKTNYLPNKTNSSENTSNETKLENVTSKRVIKMYKKADPRKRKVEAKSIFSDIDTAEWRCPNISQSENLEYLCSCDMPHTLRCSGYIDSLQRIADGLRSSPYTVSLLDCTLRNVSFLNIVEIFKNVSLHGLVISSGEIKRIHRFAFNGIKTPLQVLGLPNNALENVPSNALVSLTSLDRLDLSNNQIKRLATNDFMLLKNLTYLELSGNQIWSISTRAFAPLKKLTTLKLNGNRLGDTSTALQSIGICLNLKELDLKSNLIKGPLRMQTLPTLPALESLNLDRNLLSNIQNAALQMFPYLTTLSLRHNMIDVLQDHAFSGLSSLQELDLAFNGIVAVSGASLLHLSKLLVLDLSHNFLRALTTDLINPLPSLRELRLTGNDISIVSKNALNGATELQSLSLQENPLSCDCTLKPFAEWLTVSKIPPKDLLGAICATPPHLEGAPVYQIPTNSLNCDGNSNEYNNFDIMQQIDIISKYANQSYASVDSDIISLKSVHVSEDYGIILTWSVNMRNDEFKCAAVFLYKETSINEMLLDNSPVRCESYTMGDENIISVILRDTAGLALDESYRFCLLLLLQKNKINEKILGCSNITKLEYIDAINLEQYQSPSTTNFSDISIFEKFFGTTDEINNKFNHQVIEKDPKEIDHSSLIYDEDQTMALFGHTNRSILPFLGFGLLITSLFAIIWGVNKLRNSRNDRNGSVSYSAAIDQTSDIDEIDNRNRYSKLQATTCL